jgi:hypothetical protein
MLHTEDSPDDELGRRIQRALRNLPDAPAAWQRQAINLWPGVDAPSMIRNAAQRLQVRIAALLSFDSWAMPAVATGMRSLRSPTRQLLFSAGGRDIDLRIAPADPAYSLSGQVLGPDESAHVELSFLGSDAGAARVTQLSELGEFRVEGLQPGRYSLTLHTGTEVVLVPPFDVGDAPC